MRTRILWDNKELSEVFHEMDRLLGLNWTSSNLKLLEQAQEKLPKNRRKKWYSSTTCEMMKRFSVWRKSGKQEIPEPISHVAKTKSGASLGRPKKIQQFFVKWEQNGQPACFSGSRELVVKYISSLLAEDVEAFTFGKAGKQDE